MVHASIYVILQGFICAISPVNGLISFQTPIRLRHCLGFQRKLQERSVNQVGMSFMSDNQELRPPKAMYTHVVDIGASKAIISPFRTFLMGFYSGCHIAFGAALALGVGGSCPSMAQSNPGLQKFMSGAFGLPLGVLMTTISGGELFTVNNAFLTSALVEKKASIKDLLKNWSFSYAGNFLGSLFIAWMAFNSGLLGDSAVATALSKTSLPFKTLFIRSVLANWLVCTGVYMASGCASLSSKAIAIWFPVSAVIALSLDFSVFNMFLIPLGILRGAKITYAQFLLFMVPVTLGNVVGGAGFVGLGYSAMYGSLYNRFIDLQRAFIEWWSPPRARPSTTVSKQMPYTPYKVIR